MRRNPGPRVPNPNPPPVGITMGDPAGIGPEVILKSMLMQDGGYVRVIGSRPVFERTRKRLHIRLSLACVDDSVPDPGRYRMGAGQRNCGRAALQALEVGVELLRQRTISALVTAPVSKEALRMAGFRWPGQTEFLAERLEARRHAMLAWTPSFKVVLVTIHEPLARVSRHITAAEVVEKARMLNRFLLDARVRRPRICVMAFNPHATEFSLGEEARIAEGVRRARRSGIHASGPVPADAAVAHRRDWNGYVAMYHDQAMIPAKAFGRDQGVNVTLGLGRIRTSPLHGVAFDIADKGIANPTSMLAAIRLARRLAWR